jgi:hypothetical protein
MAARLCYGGGWRHRGREVANVRKRQSLALEAEALDAVITLTNFSVENHLENYPSKIIHVGGRICIVSA